MAEEVALPAALTTSLGGGSKSSRTLEPSLDPRLWFSGTGALRRAA